METQWLSDAQNIHYQHGARKMTDKEKRKKVEHIMNKYGVGDCRSLLEDLVKEKMADKEKSRKVAYVLMEYGMEDCTELLEEHSLSFWKESECDESECKFIEVAGDDRRKGAECRGKQRFEESWHPVQKE